MAHLDSSTGFGKAYGPRLITLTQGAARNF